MPVNAEEDENGEVEIQAHSFIENEDGTEGELQLIPEDSEDEWNMIEEVFNSFMERVQSGDCITPTPQKLESRNIRWMFLALRQEIRNTGTSGGRFSPRWNS